MIPSIYSLCLNIFYDIYYYEYFSLLPYFINICVGLVKLLNSITYYDICNKFCKCLYEICKSIIIFGIPCFIQIYVIYKTIKLYENIHGNILCIFIMESIILIILYMLMIIFYVSDYQDDTYYDITDEKRERYCCSCNYLHRGTYYLICADYINSDRRRKYGCYVGRNTCGKYMVIFLYLYLQILFQIINYIFLWNYGTNIQTIIIISNFSKFLLIPLICFIKFVMYYVYYNCVRHVKQINNYCFDYKDEIDETSIINIRNI